MLSDENMTNNYTANNESDTAVLTCPNCKARFAISTQILAENEGARFHCPQCDNVFDTLEANVQVITKDTNSDKDTSQTDSEIVSKSKTITNSDGVDPATTKYVYGNESNEVINNVENPNTSFSSAEKEIFDDDYEPTQAVKKPSVPEGLRHQSDFISEPEDFNEYSSVDDNLGQVSENYLESNSYNDESQDNSQDFDSEDYVSTDDSFDPFADPEDDEPYQYKPVHVSMYHNQHLSAKSSKTTSSNGYTYNHEPTSQFQRAADVSTYANKPTFNKTETKFVFSDNTKSQETTSTTQITAEQDIFTKPIKQTTQGNKLKESDIFNFKASNVVDSPTQCNTSSAFETTYKESKPTSNTKFEIPSQSNNIDFTNKAKTKGVESPFESFKPASHTQTFKKPTFNFNFSYFFNAASILTPIFILLGGLYLAGDSVTTSKKPSILRAFLPQAPQLPPPELLISDLKISPVILNSGEIIQIISGVLQNGTNQTYKNIELEGLVFNSEGAILYSRRLKAGNSFLNQNLESLTPEIIEEYQNKNNTAKFEVAPISSKEFSLALVSDNLSDASFFSARIYSAQ